VDAVRLTLAPTPPAARAHRRRVERERADLARRLERRDIEGLKLAILARARSRTFGDAVVRAAGREFDRASDWVTLAGALRRLAQDERTALATFALLGRNVGVGTGEELRERGNLIALLDLAADVACGRRSDRSEPTTTIHS
jgi:hypothetical protein